MIDEVEVDTKTVEPEKPTLSLDQFLNQSFECVFNQNVHLHRALAQVLQEEFKKLKDQNSDLEDKIDTLEKNLKEGFLHYTREIMKGLDASNQVVIDILQPSWKDIPPPELIRKSSPLHIIHEDLE